MSKAIKNKNPKKAKRIVQEPLLEDAQKNRAKALRLFGLLSLWDEIDRGPWLDQLLDAIGIGGMSVNPAISPSHTTGHTGPYHGGSSG